MEAIRLLFVDLVLLGAIIAFKCAVFVVVQVLDGLGIMGCS